MWGVLFFFFFKQGLFSVCNSVNKEKILLEQNVCFFFFKSEEIKMPFIFSEAENVEETKIEGKEEGTCCNHQFL